MKIGFLVIATNKYTVYVNPLVASINKYALTNHTKTVFCFTDNMAFETDSCVVKIYQEHLPWPMSTLKRYEIFYKNREYFKDMDYLFYTDADMLVNDCVGDEFIPYEKDLMCVIHPGYLINKIQSYEFRINSKACVPPGHHVYHCGGIQGGKKDKYLEVCKKLSEDVNDDYSRGIIAEWHDESHWNNYLIRNPNSYKELDASYCYPESWNIPAKKIILALDKNHAEMRS